MKALFEAPVNIPATIFAAVCFAYAGWYYYFQPQSFHRMIERERRYAPAFIRLLLATAKPMAVVCFAISAFLIILLVGRLIIR